MSRLVAPSDTAGWRLGRQTMAGGFGTSITTTSDIEITTLACAITSTGRPARIYFLMTNQMFTAAGKLRIKFWDGAVGGTQIGSSITLASLAANDSDTVGGSIGWTPSAGAHTVRMSAALVSTTGSPSGVIGAASHTAEVSVVEE